MSLLAGVSGSNSYAIALRRRRTVLRIGAEPTVLLTMNPNRAPDPTAEFPEER